jgi:hypothetical protein
VDLKKYVKSGQLNKADDACLVGDNKWTTVNRVLEKYSPPVKEIHQPVSIPPTPTPLPVPASSKVTQDMDGGAKASTNLASKSSGDKFSNEGSSRAFFAGLTILTSFIAFVVWCVVEWDGSKVGLSIFNCLFGLLLYVIWVLLGRSIFSTPGREHYWILWVVLFTLVITGQIESFPEIDWLKPFRPD